MRPRRSTRRRFLQGSATMLGGVAVLPFISCDGGGDEGSPPAPTPLPTPTSAPGTAGYIPAPGTTWETVSPAAAGWDAAKLSAALDYAGETNATGVVMLSGGRILAERYWKVGSRYTGDIASAQKSVLSVLVGIAQAEGKLAIGDPVEAHLDHGWSRAPASHEDRITIRHLLTMTSGLDDQFRPIGEPGALWRYSNAYSALHDVVARATGTPLADYAQARLFGPLGLEDTTYYTRPGGDPDITSVGVKMTPRDMARFGLLVLRGGRWGERQLVPDAYVAESLQPSQTYNRSYGFLWWLNGKESYMLPGVARVLDGPLVPSAPSDAVAALGRGDKKIYAVPSLDLVVTRWGLDATGAGGDAPTSFDRAFWERIMAARV